MKKSDIIQGVKNYVIDWCGVKKGENVLVLTDERNDQLTIDTIVEVARGTGANVVVVKLPYVASARTGPGGSPCYDFVLEALKKTDKMLRCTKSFIDIDDKELRQLLVEYGLRAYNLSEYYDAEYFASEAAKFPSRLALEITRRAIEMARSGKNVHITTPKGTDFKIEVQPDDWGGAWTQMYGNPPGEFSVFPGGVVAALPTVGTAEGTIVYEVMGGYHVLGGPVKRLIKVRCKNGRIVDITGGQEARILKKLFWSHKNSRHCARMFFGTHPKTRPLYHLVPGEHPGELERSAGAAEIAFGDACFLGGKIHSAIHEGGYILKPTITVDDKVIVDNGRPLALDDPDVRRIAKEYGDPDYLLGVGDKFPRED